MQGKLVFNSQIDNIYTSVNTFNIGNKVASGQYMLRVRMAGKKDVLKFFEVSSWQTGAYNVSLVSGSLREVKRLVVSH